MKAIRALLFFSTVLFAWGIAASAHARESIALSFELDPVPPTTPETPPAVTPEATETATAVLPIPAAATQPPLANPTAVSPPVGIYGGGQSLAWGEGAFPEDIEQHLPAPPPIPPGLLAAALPQPQALTAGNVAAPAAAPEVAPAPPDPALSTEAIDGILTFEPPAAPIAVAARPATTPGSTPLQASGADTILTRLFDGGPDSLVARAVGSAEGTRTPEGHRTPAYFGHVDPGNGVWNLGSFSYQHGARSPEEADQRQLQRLQEQTLILQRKAAALNLQLSAEELVNGIDLANQAPAAALDRESYLDWLQRARTLGMEGQDAIVWARTRAFLDPDTQQWNAPGLGNNVYSITRDQERRAQAIAAALTVTPPPLEATVSAEVEPAAAPESAAAPKAPAHAPINGASPPEAVDTALLLREQFRLESTSASTTLEAHAARPARDAQIQAAAPAIAAALAHLLAPTDRDLPAIGATLDPTTSPSTVATAAPLLPPSDAAGVEGDVEGDRPRPESAPTPAISVPPLRATAPTRWAIGAQPQTQVWSPDAPPQPDMLEDSDTSQEPDTSQAVETPAPASNPSPSAAQMPRG